MNSSESQPSKLGKFLDGRKLPPSSQYLIAITIFFDNEQQWNKANATAKRNV